MYVVYLSCDFVTKMMIKKINLKIWKSSLISGLWFGIVQFLNRNIQACPGRLGTEEFVPEHLLLPLSRDKGTPGQENVFVLGLRDNGTFRPGLSQDVLSLGNPTRYLFWF